MGQTSKRIIRELIITLLASLLLLLVAYVFLGKQKAIAKAGDDLTVNEFLPLWKTMDAKLLESYIDSEKNTPEGEYGLDIEIATVEAKYGEEIVKSFLSYKFRHWILMAGGIVDVSDDLVSRVFNDELDGIKIHNDNGKTWGLKEALDEIDKMTDSSIGLPISRWLNDNYIAFYKLSLQDMGRLPYADLSLEDTGFKTQLGRISISDRPQKGPSGRVQTIFYISLSVFIVTMLVTLMSRFIARLIAASFLQDLITERNQAAGFKTGVLPYLFSVPAFIWAIVISSAAAMGMGLKFLAIILIIVVAGGLSFELVLKYLDQSGLEYNKPYARYLHRYKRDRSRKGIMALISTIFMPARNKVLGSTKALDPYVLTGADYQLMDYVKRRMTVVVDAYALVGIVFSFKMWFQFGKPDLVDELLNAAGRYGFSFDVIVLIEAILLGILASKIVMLLSEHRQFPGD